MVVMAGMTIRFFNSMRLIFTGLKSSLSIDCCSFIFHLNTIAASIIIPSSTSTSVCASHVFGTGRDSCLA